MIDSILKKKNEGETTSSASPVENQDTSLQNTSKENRQTNKGTIEKNRDHRTLERNENSKDIDVEDDNREAKFEPSNRITRRNLETRLRKRGTRSTRSSIMLTETETLKTTQTSFNKLRRWVFD